jgi:choline kinase
VKPRLAVILAAGRGVRLGALGLEMPKGFITMGGQTLIERSISALRAAGIERVRIVTGHLAGHYEALATRLGDWVSLTHNPDYATTGSLASLMSAGPIDESYLLVESDLIYEPRAPRLLIESSDPDLLLASGSTGSGDEVYVAAENGRLIDLTKRLEDLRGPRVGELVGLTRVSPPLHAAILAQAKGLLATTRLVEYETALVAAARHHPLPVLVVEDLIWTEVDDARHLARASAVVLPRLGA